MSTRNCLFILIVATVLIASCKNKKNNYVFSPKIEIIKNSEGDTGNLIAIGVGIPDAPQKLFTLKNTTYDNSNEPIHVVLEMDEAFIISTGFTPLPLSYLKDYQLEYDVPANGTVDVMATFDGQAMTLGSNYGLAFRVKEVSKGEANSQANFIQLVVSVRNRWDGRYILHGTFTDYAGPTHYYCCDQELDLQTMDATHVKVFNRELNDVGYIFQGDTSRLHFAQFGLYLGFDPATNKINELVNFYGQPSGNGRSAEADANYNNAWDPTTKNMSVRYWMNQPSVISGHRCLFEETWTYMGPRTF